MELERTSGIEKSTIHRILCNELLLRKIAARAYEPELKRLSAEWRHAGSLRRQKVRQNPSTVKLLVIVTYDVWGVIVRHFVPHGRTVAAQYYRDFQVQQVQRGVLDTRPDLVDSAILLHDNARPHKAGNYSNVGDLKNWSTHRTLSTFSSVLKVSNFGIDAFLQPIPDLSTCLLHSVTQISVRTNFLKRNIEEILRMSDCEGFLE
ncbi:uncharacterized protein TNIN_484391 [Trichonephila inaurata madagascariensis]|uniref:Transposase n=1 Tax=Trichonephila inaurata madagascariensis TaxID=2747483 RepID=A0A8X7CJS7_9ARAC|nr:uncharacterized protein TNIN_484391 [Trichonephila inaurata madagascariensis]